MSTGRRAAPIREKTERVMLLRDRKSRIYFLRKLFEYPIAQQGHADQTGPAAHRPHRDQLCEERRCFR